MTLRKVVSGGQVGADIAGVRAAQKAGLETGGWMPAGFRTLFGARPAWAEEFGLREHSSDGYPGRTRLNVQMSDATVRLARDFTTSGERLTLRYCQEFGKPVFDVRLRRGAEEGVMYASPAYTDLAVWLRDNFITVLNVAGNARPFIEEFVEQYLLAAFELLRLDG